MIRRYISLRTPSIMCDSVLKLSIVDLRGCYLLIDVDNTLCLRQSEAVDVEVVQFLRQLRTDGVVHGICLVSNVVTRSKRRIERVARIADQLDCEFVCAHWPRIKPKPHPYREALAKLGNVDPRDAVMIGDQLFTDILGANRLGMRTALVRPLGQDSFITRPRRVWEGLIVKLRRLYNITSPPH